MMKKLQSEQIMSNDQLGISCGAKVSSDVDDDTTKPSEMMQL